MYIEWLASSIRLKDCQNARAPAAVLYVTYDGVLEPLGESQVLAYLERLAGHFAITLLSFEKHEDARDTARVRAMEQRLTTHGISWVRLSYHKWPPVLSSLFDSVVGAARARAVCRSRRVRIVHARGYLPSLIALGARGASRAKYLFDMRGFWVNEKVEAGHWRGGGALERIAKWWERRFLRSADGIVSLTAAGVSALPALGYQGGAAAQVEVIPTCVDLDRFRPRPRDRELAETLGLADAPVIGCVGTMSNWYLRREMLQYLAHLARELPRLQVLLVTREDEEALRRDAATEGMPHGRLVITRAPYDQMPRFMTLFEAGVFFIRPTFAKRGSAATKLAEFLATGVPVIINDGVGDSGDIVRAAGAGLVLTDLDEWAFAQSLPSLQGILNDPDIRERCRRAAVEFFDVNQGAIRYRRLYERLAGDALSSQAAPRPTRKQEES
ncbi:MAG: glycosyltransferase [Acidobacteriota bacterium]